MPCPLSEARAPARAFVFSGIRRVTYFAYLDEFGHIGPYLGRSGPKYNESPVFGLAGFVLPAEAVRGFGTWFFQRKCDLLDFEIKRSAKHPAEWEKKGASLYTVTNVIRYPELRRLTNRLFDKINGLGGFVFYVGVKKTLPPASRNPNRLYARVFLEAIKRIDGFCEEDCRLKRFPAAGITRQNRTGTDRMVQGQRPTGGLDGGVMHSRRFPR